MPTPYSRTADQKNIFAGPFAGTRGTNLPQWKCVTCPKKTCQAGPGASCRRLTIEKIDGVETGRHYTRLKNPHPERVQLAKRGGEAITE